MVRIRVTCVIKGPTFSPSVAERTTGLSFFKKKEPGRAELAIQEYGELAELSGKNAGALAALARSVEALRRCGATDLRLRFEVEYAGGDCHFELPSELIRRFGELGIPLAVACFPTEQTEELGDRDDF